MLTHHLILLQRLDHRHNIELQDEKTQPCSERVSWSYWVSKIGKMRISRAVQYVTQGLFIWLFYHSFVQTMRRSWDSITPLFPWVDHSEGSIWHWSNDADTWFILGKWSTEKMWCTSSQGIIIHFARHLNIMVIWIRSLIGQAYRLHLK